jgi:hypothetical protein
VQFFRGDKPDRIVIDGQRPSVTPDWTSSFLAATREARAYWDSRSKQLGLLAQKQLVILHRREGFSTGDEGRALIEVFPFDVCSLGSVFFDEWVEADYRRWSFSRGHYDHGWGCAFRGAGHDRLHSRRWLDFGPWRVIRRPNDTTFIQFHDLGITDPAEAYEQAKVGHQRMGIDPIGGFIQGIDTDVLKEVQGLYRPETKTLEIIVVPGLEVTQQQMRVACGLRLHHRLTKPMVDRVEKIAYVFAAKEDARAHLHELWLRELECWYLDETGKHRLDTEYKPTPQPPAWVKAVEARGD